MFSICAFLSALLWGTYFAAKKHRGYRSTKMVLPKKPLIGAAVLLALPLRLSCSTRSLLSQSSSPFSQSSGT